MVNLFKNKTFGYKKFPTYLLKLDTFDKFQVKTY